MSNDQNPYDIPATWLIPGSLYIYIYHSVAFHPLHNPTNRGELISGFSATCFWRAGKPLSSAVRFYGSKQFLNVYLPTVMLEHWMIFVRLIEDVLTNTLYP